MTGSPIRTNPSRGYYVLLFAALALLILAISYFFSWNQLQEIRGAMHENLAFVAKMKEEQIETWRRGLLFDLRRDAAAPSLIQALEKPAHPAARAMALQCLGATLRQGTYASAALFSSAGQPVLSAGNGVIRPDPALLASARAGSDGVLSDFFRDEEGELSADLAAAIRHSDGKFLGFVVLRLRANDGVSPLIQSWPTKSSTGEFLLFRREGDEVVCLNDLRHHPDAALNLRIPMTRTDMPAVQAVLGYTGLFTGMDYRNREVVADLRRISGTPWFLVTKMDRSEIMAEARYRTFNASIIAGILILLAGSVAAMLYRARQTGHLRKLLDVERLQKQSDTNFRLLLESMHEGFALHEMIFDESGQPADYRFLWVNAVFERQTGRRSQDVVGRTVLEVFPETEKFWIERYGKVAQSGEPAHFEEYSKILDKYFRVTAFSPQPGRVATVFEDITNRKASDAKIARLTRFYLALSQCNQAIVHAANPEELLPQICRIIVELGGMGMAWIGMLDEASGEVRPVASFGSGSDYLQGIKITVDPATPHGCGPAGRSIREKHPVWCEDFMADPTTRPWQERASLSGWRAAASLPLMANGKGIGVLTIYSDKTGAFDEETRKLLVDMSEDISLALGNFSKEEALRESEERFRRMFQQIPSVAIQGYNEAGVTQYWNEASERLYGYSASEAIGRNLLDLIIPPEMREKFKEAMGKMAETGQAIPPSELSLMRKDGSRVSVFSSHVMVKIQGRPKEFFCVDIDLTARNEAELKLRESESRFRMLVENLPLALIYGDRNQSIVYRNERFAELFGYSAEDVPDVGAWWKQAYPDPQYRSEVMAQWEAEIRQASLENREIRPMEYRITCKNGEVRTVEIGGLLLDGALLATFDDITERKRAEKALRESEIHFRTTFEQAAVGMAHVAMDGRWLLVNQKLCDIVGYSMEELLQKSFLDITHPDDLEADHELMRKSRTGELTTFRLVKRYIRKDKTVVWVCLTVSIVPGKPDYYIAVIEDITGRMKTEAQLRLRSTALEASANAMVITNDRGEIEWTNPAFTRFTGYSAEEALGKTPSLLKSGKHDRAFYKNLWDTIHAGKVWSGEIVNRRKDGSDYTEEMTITPMKDQEGKISHFIAVKQDVTESRLMEQKILRTQRMESIGTLAAGVAHDLNNILTPILLSADLLRKADSPEVRDKMVLNIEKSVKRGADIIAQVLTFARGTSGQRIPLNIAEIVAEIDKIIFETFPRSITISSFIPPGLAQVNGDVTQIHQVLLNLCINARDAMPDGGALVISGANVRIDGNFAAPVPDAREGDYVMLSVVDNGIGMSKEVMARIFDPFFTTKEIGRGTGLGLSTVVGIVRSHGGFITVESEQDLGSVFKVFLPVSGSKSAESGKWVAGGLPMGQGETILLVEDEANILAVTAMILSGAGYQVLKASDGREALEIFQDRPGEISLVLTDIMMPKMDGLQLARKLRKLSPQVKIMASTGQATEEGEAALRALGVRVILHKPYDARELLLSLFQEIRAAGGS